MKQACRLEELDGQGLIECNMSTGTYFTKSKSTAQEYTTCILRTKTHVQWVVCSFGIWVKLDEREGSFFFIFTQLDESTVCY